MNSNFGGRYEVALRPWMPETAGGMQDKLYPRVLQAFILSAIITLGVFITALSVAIGPGVDWHVNYVETTCHINSAEPVGLVECQVPPSEFRDQEDTGIRDNVPCVQVNVSYINGSGATRIAEIALPNRAVLLAEYSEGATQREYTSADYTGPAIPRPDGVIDTSRKSTLTRALFGTRSCTFLDCRDAEEAADIARNISARYEAGTTIPCYYFQPRQGDPDVSALVVLSQVQSDGDITAWAVCSFVGLLVTWPCCLFLCCREWLCRCSGRLRRLQYF